MRNCLIAMSFVAALGLGSNAFACDSDTRSATPKEENSSNNKPARTDAPRKTSEERPVRERESTWPDFHYE